MREGGMLPVPRKLVKQGGRNMLRISDARKSGTSYGACILHVAPESLVGGPLAFVETGDEIEVGVLAGRIHLHVSDEELARTRVVRRRTHGRDGCATSFAAMFVRLHTTHRSPYGDSSLRAVGATGGGCLLRRLFECHMLLPRKDAAGGTRKAAAGSQGTDFDA